MKDLPMLMLNSDDVRRALPMPDAIQAMKNAFACISSEQVIAPPRACMPIEPDDGLTLVMPSYVNDPSNLALAVKIVSLFGGNEAKGLARIQATVLAMDPKTGHAIALLEGAMLTALRTGAGSGAATDLLARTDAQSIAILGAGAQGRTQLESVLSVRPIRHITIFDQNAEHAEAMAREIRDGVTSEFDVKVASSANEAIDGADIICAATVASTPVFDDKYVAPGTHINAIGSFQPHMREIPPETVVRSRVFVESREAAMEEAGDIIQPVEAGLIGWDHIRGEIGEVVLEKVVGRENDEQVTFFKSVGHAAQDAFAASVAIENARRDGVGNEVDW